MKPVNYTLMDEDLGQFKGDLDRICDWPLDHQGDVYCWRETGHDGPHEAIVCGSACPGCGGLDLHDDDCPQRDLTTREIAFARWEDDRERCGVGHQLFSFNSCHLHQGHDGDHRDGTSTWDDKWSAGRSTDAEVDDR